MQLKVLGCICTELPPTLTPGNGRSSSVRHHGKISILGGEQETLQDKDVNGRSQCITDPRGNDATPATIVSGISVTPEHMGLWIRGDHG